MEPLEMGGQMIVEADLSFRSEIDSQGIPIHLSIPVVMARRPPSAETAAGFPMVTPTASVTIPNRRDAMPRTGRERFIHQLMVAQECRDDGRLEAATTILCDLADQIDRFHLDEWESPNVVIRTWELLVLCSMRAPASVPAERVQAILRRLCRLDPHVFARVISSTR